MEKIELVEKLQEKTGISAEEAWTALEKNGWVLVDAMLWLETEKGIPSQTGKASSATDKEQFQPVTPTMGDNHKTNDSLLEKLKKLLRDSLEHFLVLRYREKDMLRVPVLILLILLLSSFYVVIIGLLIALFCGCSFSIDGPTSDANDAMNKAMHAAEEAAKKMRE